MSEYTIQATRHFNEWLGNLKDRKARAVILRRIEQAGRGLWGDCEHVGAGISEMRVFVGPGYRIYFCRIGPVLFMLLNASDKTDQSRAIREAKRILADLKESQNG